ncbi:hypothetical protein QR680_007563 [Steinernema hermaphroditum]|uniref:Tyrosine-protein kinase n=1 Tax=Steinernema hermaphroditum TaxID=289476 RepID=A0AA39IDJ4_9BILA|nr:hypothetical protein QR680_007563 [Steinernema hermaphroditum]
MSSMQQYKPKTDKRQKEKSINKSLMKEAPSRMREVTRRESDTTEESMISTSTSRESLNLRRRREKENRERIKIRIENLKKRVSGLKLKDTETTEEIQTLGEDITRERDVLKESAKDLNLRPYAKMMENEQKALSQLEWQVYHGLMPREEIEDLLRKDGDFCLRKTEVAKCERYAISVYWSGRVRHILPKLNCDRKWFIKAKDFSSDKLEKLLQFYITSKSDLLIEGTKLLNGVSRPDWYILHEHVNLKKKLGNGNFGDVFLGELLLKNSEKAERGTFMKEASLMRRFNHDNIVRILGVAPQQEPIMILLELASGGCLKNHCREKTDITVADLARYCLDAAQGMEYLSAHTVIHRDIAARNCLLTDKFVVKISDFGLSCADRTEVKESKLKNVPVKWLAPETLNFGVFTTKTDVWSFGIMMWEIFSRCKTDPYPGMSNKDTRAMVQTDGRMDPPEEAPKRCAELMKKCWLAKPEERPDWPEIVRRLSEECGVAPQKLEKTPSTFIEETYCAGV